ncbi:MAG: cell division protein FtsQ/DivIB [Acidobacteriaceae bacterium]
MAKNTRSEGRTGLLEDEEASRLFRQKFNTEIADIPNPVVDGPTSREAESPFLRSQRRVPVRRRGGPRFSSRFGFGTRWVRLLKIVAIIAVLGLVAMAGLAVKSFLLHNRHFILQSTEGIQVSGNRVVTRSQALAFFAPDVGHSIFRISLVQRQAQLEEIKWVRSATVMRFWPNRLRVTLVERSPVAFALDGNTVRLMDDQGTLLDLPNAVAQHYSFPVLTGIIAADPLPIRAARVAMYLRFVHALDAQDGHIASTLSQVDLSDPEDVRAIFTGGVRQPLVHFGDSDYLARYQAYRAHLTEWLQQYPELRSVDMRYGKQVVLDTGSVANGSSTPLDGGTAAHVVAPPTSEATAAKGPTQTAASSVIAAKPTAKPTAKRAKRPASPRVSKTHRKNGTHSRGSKHAPQRGHTVRDPIMHVVSGM